MESNTGGRKRDFLTYVSGIDNINNILGKNEINFSIRRLNLKESRIRLFDLILFKDTDIVSGGITKFSRVTTGGGNFSHCAVVITKEVAPYIKELEADKFYFLESTFSYNIVILGMHVYKSGANNVVDGNGWFGVQIREATEVIKNYGGTIYKAHLLNNPWYHLNDFFITGQYTENNREIKHRKLNPEEEAKLQIQRGKIIDIFGKIYTEYYHKIYNLNPLDLVSLFVPAIRPFRNLSDEITRIFDPAEKYEIHRAICSYLTALVYQSLGLISPDVNVENSLPVDLAGYDKRGIGKIICRHIVQLN